tara:strand:+ start:163 stop:375 length:213 start_codon:yes stop_codon:yes gene_type:complete
MRYDGAWEHRCGFIDDTGDHFFGGMEHDDLTGCPDCDRKAEEAKYADWEPDAETAAWMAEAIDHNTNVWR